MDTPIEEPRPQEAPPPRNGNRRKVTMAVVALVAVAGLVFGVRTWLYNRGHVTTDDAFVTSDIVPVSAKVAGNVTAVRVKDNQRVKAGDLLVQLDDSTYQADVRQAEANVLVAQASVGGAAADVGLTAQT